MVKIKNSSPGKHVNAGRRVKEVNQKLVRLGHRAVGFGVGGFAMNRFIDFLTMNRNFLGGDNPQPNFVATDFHDGNGNVIVNDNTFVFFPGQY